jgi:hypothetical protein
MAESVERRAHEPLKQLSPSEHAWPQAPQCSAEEVSLVSHVLARFWSQSAVPAAHAIGPGALGVMGIAFVVGGGGAALHEMSARASDTGAMAMRTSGERASMAARFATSLIKLK